MTFSGRRGGGRGGRSFRGGGRRSSVRTIRGGGLSNIRSPFRAGRSLGIRSGRSTYGSGDPVKVGSQATGTTKVTVHEDSTARDAYDQALATSRLLGTPPPAGPRPTVVVTVTIEVVWEATATVTAAWRDSGAEAGSLSYTISGSFTTTRTSPVDVDSTVETIVDNMLDSAASRAEGLALAKANNLARAALEKAASEISDYLNLGGVSVSSGLR